MGQTDLCMVHRARSPENNPKTSDCSKRPPKGGDHKTQASLPVNSIQGILAGARDYATGIKIQRREGDHFEIQIEPILDMKTYERFLQVRRKPGNRMPSYVKNYGLLRRLLYCDCSYRWRSQGMASHSQTVGDQWVKRSEIHGVYVCPNLHDELISPQCPRRIPLQGGGP